MNPLARLLYSIFAGIALIYVLTSIFEFFGIGFESYGVYLFYMLALMLFFSLLPDDRSNFFSLIVPQENVP